VAAHRGDVDIISPNGNPYVPLIDGLIRFLRDLYRPVTGASRDPRIVTIAETVPAVGYMSARWSVARSDAISRGMRRRSTPSCAATHIAPASDHRAQNSEKALPIRVLDAVLTGRLQNRERRVKDRV
jgi:hypothetical protein